MRYLHNKETGRSLPLPDRLQVAAVGRAGAGSQHDLTLSDRTVRRGGGGSVLPVCALSGGAGRNGSRDCLHRRDEAGEPCGTVYLCVAEERGEAACQSEGEGALGSFDHKSGSAGAAACRDGSRDLICPWPRSQEERRPKGMGGAGRAAPEMAGLRRKARCYGHRPQQLFQDRPGRHLYADEGRPYAKRAAQARVQCADRGQQRIHHRH